MRAKLIASSALAFVAGAVLLFAGGKALANVLPLDQGFAAGSFAPVQPAQPMVPGAVVPQTVTIPATRFAVRAPTPARLATPARLPSRVREAPGLQAPKRFSDTTPSASCTSGGYIPVKHYPQYDHATQSGCASNYGGGAGECASNNAPIGTIVSVTNLENGQSTTCRVAGTGPFVSGRPIDLSQDVFDRLAPPSEGVFHVRVSW